MTKFHKSRSVYLFVVFIFVLLAASFFLTGKSLAFRNPDAAPPTATAVIDIDVNAPVGSLTIGSTGAIVGGSWQGSAIGISYGGTGATTASSAINALLPSQTGQAGNFLTSNGTNVSWGASGGGVTSLSAGVGITLTPNPIIATGTIANAGVISASCTSPLSCSGTNPASFSIPQATNVISGYLSSSDWTTFNNKLSTSSDYGRSGISATLYEGATALSSKYLGISAKAADANLLDGLDSTSFLSTASDYGRFGVSGTLYESSTPLSSKYLGISAKAADSNLLDGYDNTSFIKTGGGTMSGSLTAPSFFDYNNTTYYVDPSFTGYSIYLAGSIGAFGPFYDLDNTSYYVNPAGTTNLSTLCLGGVCNSSWPGASESDTLQTVTNRGNVTSNFIRVPWYEDSDNTSYYANPSNVSYLYRVQLGIPIVSPAVPLWVNGDGYMTGWLTQGSDVRLKKDIEPLSNALGNVLQLTGVYYRWNQDAYPEREMSEGLKIGLIAQDVEEILPELVYTDTEGYKSVAYGHLSAVLIEAIKEQQQQIDELKLKVEELEQKLFNN